MSQLDVREGVTKSLGLAEWDANSTACDLPGLWHSAGGGFDVIGAFPDADELAKRRH
ncbi:MAG: hypothetical protein IKE66_10145 [Hyphomicrobium sp.]|nr:hypothetical protein [Hyphomicrobium sp.]